MSNHFQQMVSSAPFILTEGSVVERLRRNPTVELDDFSMAAGFIYREPERSVLTKLYREYLDIGQEFDLPMLIYTPTWRADSEKLKISGFSASDDVNGDCFRFLTSIRETYATYAAKIFIGGLMACKNDAYKPEESLSTAEALKFHRFQVDALAEAGVDFLVAATLPALPEAAGIAEAMAKSNLPYALSFIIDDTGSLLDGTPLCEAVNQIDSDVVPKPLFYRVNCVHPAVFEKGMARQVKKNPDILQRLIGLQANTSEKKPEELENLDYLDTTEPETLASAMIRIHHLFGTRMLGGCCGTDGSHIHEIARRMTGLHE